MFVEIYHNEERLIIEESRISQYDGCVVLDRYEDVPADNIYAMPSREHLSSVHLQKVLEATIILSGHDLDAGILSEEAGATGVAVKDLAERVLEKRKLEREYEIERRKWKTAVG